MAQCSRSPGTSKLLVPPGKPARESASVWDQSVSLRILSATNGQWPMVNGKWPISCHRIDHCPLSISHFAGTANARTALKLYLIVTTSPHRRLFRKKRFKSSVASKASPRKLVLYEVCASATATDFGRIQDEENHHDPLERFGHVRRHVVGRGSKPTPGCMVQC